MKTIKVYSDKDCEEFALAFVKWYNNKSWEHDYREQKSHTDEELMVIYKSVARLLPCKEETREKSDNEVIAEFMGFSCADTGQDRFWNPPGMPFATIYDWKYHSNHLDAFQTSWDWLMPVVEKIERLGNRCEIGITKCKIYSADYNREPVYGATKIQAVYDHVVDYIKWYNEHGK